MAKTNPRDVFINCPFDDEYNATFQAIIFTVRACGFRVRCARELEDAGETRIEKLYRIIEESRYGIHDLCRTELDAINNLPRFNMPLELGMFLGAKRFGGDDQKVKNCIVFDVDQYRYQKFVSDLAGVDIYGHGGDVRKVVKKTRDWLANVSRRSTIVSTREVTNLYSKFAADLPGVADEAGFEVNELAYADFERIVQAWLKQTIKAMKAAAA